MRARSLAGLLVLVCLAAGCSSNNDDQASGPSGTPTNSESSTPSGAKSSAAKSSDGPSSGKASGGGTSGTTSGSGADKIDPMKSDNGAPGALDAKGRQTVLFDRLPGNTSGACETVGDRRDVKSGGFVGGAFDDARKSYGKVRPGMGRKQVRLYWMPEHTKPMAGLTVTATSSGQKVRVTQRHVADVEQWKFYDTNITLPQGGSWRFQVSSGPDRGCFVASF